MKKIFEGINVISNLIWYFSLNKVKRKKKIFSANP